MKYIKIFEVKKPKPAFIIANKLAEKEGNKVARQIQRLINRFLGLSKNIDDVKVNYNIFWDTFKYNFDPYLFVKMKQWKNIPRIQILINELVRLGCEDRPPDKWQKTYEDRDNRIFLLTQQQIEELLISFKNGLPFIEVREQTVFHDQIYTYKKLKFKDHISDRDIVVGKITVNYDNIKIKGLTLSEEDKEVTLKGLWTDDLKYVRKATPEEEEFYEEHVIAKKYNL